MKVAVIERGRFGGTCVNTGCIPTKALVASARTASVARRVIHCILDIMYAGAPYTVLQKAMHIHPTVSELIPTMLGELKPLAA